MNVLPPACRNAVVTLLRFWKVPLNGVRGVADPGAAPSSAAAARAATTGAFRQKELILFPLPARLPSPRESGAPGEAGQTISRRPASARPSVTSSAYSR